MEKKFHLINTFIDMPISSIPLLIIQFIFYQIQPLFCCCIYCALINSMDHCFKRTIFIGTGMRKDGIYFPIYSGKLFFCKFLNFSRRLLIGKPLIIMSKPVILIYGICTAKYNYFLAIQIINFSIFCKDQIWKFRLPPDFSTMPVYQFITSGILRPHLMISMNTENLWSKCICFFLSFIIFPTTKIVQRHIAKDNDDITFL